MGGVCLALGTGVDAVVSAGTTKGGGLRGGCERYGCERYACSSYGVFGSAWQVAPR